MNQDRRQFIGTALMTFVAAKHGVNDSPRLFGPVRQIDAGVLNVGYAEAGPAGGPPVVLLHGWPYDIHTYVDVAPLLAAKGYPVIVPYLRGYGTTRFLSSETVRNGQQSVVAVDVIALMDALKVEKAVLGGCDWGARTADIVAALWPQRCKALVSVSGYLIGSQAANRTPLPPKAELQWWYQFYFATERGRAGYEKNRRDFAKRTRGRSTTRRRSYERSGWQRLVLVSPIGPTGACMGFGGRGRATGPGAPGICSAPARKSV